MNKILTIFPVIIFSSLLSGTATASPDDITIDVIDSASDSVEDVTRHIEVPEAEDHEALEHSEQANDMDEQHEGMEDDKDEQHEDMEDDKDDSKNDMDDDKDDGRDDDSTS